MRGKNAFLKNAVVLTMASVLLRGLGMLFRVYISNVLGAEGMGLYQLVFSVYLLSSTIASAGITITVTRLVSEYRLYLPVKELKSAMLKFNAVSAAIGLATAAVFYFGSGFVGMLIKDARSVPSLQVLSLSLPFMSVSASLRGYFMARRKIAFVSASQIAEQIVRFTACAVLIGIIGRSEMPTACFAVMASDTVSELASFIIQSIAYAADIKKAENISSAYKKPKALKQFFRICAPVSGVRCVNSALSTAEGIIVPLLITSFLGVRGTALEQWGMLKGMALPLLMFPSGFMAGFIMLLVPEISENSVCGKTEKTKKITNTATKYCLMAGIAAAGAFYLLAYQLGDFLYSNSEIGFYMRVLAPLMPFIYLENVSESMLKGLDKQISTLWFSLINSAVRILLVFILAPRCGIKGFLFVMLVSNILTSYLHQNKLLNSLKLKMQWKDWVIKPCVCMAAAYAAGCATVNFAASAGGKSFAQIICGGFSLCCVYVLMCVALGCIDIKKALRKRKNGLHIGKCKL